MQIVNFVLGIPKNRILKSFFINLDQKTLFSQLIEIGHLEAPKETSSYETGETFIHRVFGYRGIIMFPWVARFFDHDSDAHGEMCYELAVVRSKNVKWSTQNFYQVLVDTRDRPFIRAHTEAITFLGCLNNYFRILYSVPGLDYVAPEDILPYTPTEKVPIKHEMFDKFFVHRPKKQPCIEVKEVFKEWQNTNSPWLKISDVHRETTNAVGVYVMPFYMGCRKAVPTPIYSWRYIIRLQNFGEMAVYLRSQTWKIFMPDGLEETIKGDGVMGRDIVLDKSSPAYQYSNHISLASPYGHMRGAFTMDKEDGTSFQCQVPLFLLDSKGGIGEKPFINTY